MNAIQEYRVQPFINGKAEYITISECLQVKIVTRLLNCWAEIITIDPESMHSKRQALGPFPKTFRARLAAWGVLQTEGQIKPEYEQRVGALWHKLINN